MHMPTPSGQNTAQSALDTCKYVQIVTDTFMLVFNTARHYPIPTCRYGITMLSLCVGIIFNIPTNKSVGMLAVCNQKYLHIPTRRFKFTDAKNTTRAQKCVWQIDEIVACTIFLLRLRCSASLVCPSDCSFSCFEVRTCCLRRRSRLFSRRFLGSSAPQLMTRPAILGRGFCIRCGTWFQARLIFQHIRTEWF